MSEQHPVGQISKAWRYVALLAISACWLSLSAIASAADYTWSGEGSASANTWSNAANWSGGQAPSSSSSIRTLSFPTLASPTCLEASPTEACFRSKNDLNGLSVNQLQIDETHSYTVEGNGFTLGSGGLSSSGQASSEPSGYSIANPITLSASQTWTIAGDPGNIEGLNNGLIQFGGALSGSSAALSINLSNSAFVSLEGSDNEIGNVTIQGVTEASPHLEVFDVQGRLNVADGNMLDVNQAHLGLFAATGPLVSHGATVEVGDQVNVTSATFDRATTAGFAISGTSAQPGFGGYDQMTSTGHIDLGSATLTIRTYGAFGGGCVGPLPVGQAEVLISTTGSISGTFGNAADGGTVIDGCDARQRYRIDYNTASSPETVTATVLPLTPAVPVNTVPPIVVGNATQGQTLSEGHGGWTNHPTSYSYQWQRCDSGGNNCQAIPGATGQTYALTATDVGSTIRVQETASNGEGASTPQVSAPSVVVQAASGSSPGGGSSGSTGGGSAGGSSTPSDGSVSTVVPTGSVNPTVRVSAAQIAALLRTQLIPIGHKIRIDALLRHGGLSIPLAPPASGIFTIDWYELPNGVKLASQIKVKAVLVAKGQASFAGTKRGVVKIRLTSVGRKLLERSKRLRLEAKGRFAAAGERPISTTREFVVGG